MLTKPKYDWTPSASSFAGPQIKQSKNSQKSDGMIIDALCYISFDGAHKIIGCCDVTFLSCIVKSRVFVKSRVGYFAYSLDDVVASTCPVTVKQ